MSSGDDGRSGLSGFPELDKLVHEPARLMILATLFVLDAADFLFLMKETGLTQGNLSSHISKLEQAGYIHVEKGFLGKRPQTMLKLTDAGRRALNRYRKQVQGLLDDLMQNE